MASAALQPAEVEKLRGSVPIAYTLPKRRNALGIAEEEPYVNSLGASPEPGDAAGRAGLPRFTCRAAVAADANTAGRCIRPEPLSPMRSELCRRINALPAADQIEHSEAAPRSTGSCCVATPKPARRPAQRIEIMKPISAGGGVHFETNWPLKRVRHMAARC